MIKYHHYQETADAITKLAVATASDHDTVATLTATNAKLTLQLKTSQAYVKKLKEVIAQLKPKMKTAWQGQRPAKMMNNDNYCLSHGYQVHKEHTSAICKNQKDGHKKEATKTNPMGGVKFGKY
jgi:methylthioribose-1-phosphate isomerase